MKVIELFAGIGSQTQALKNLGIAHEVIGISEIDKYAIKSYEAIHGPVNNFGDITKIEKLPYCDLLIHSSPCQSFSIAGKQEGGVEGSGTRSSLMWETLRLVKTNKPKFILWENVPNVLSDKHKHNFIKYLECLSELGYENNFDLLNSKDFGIPQNRLRLFCLSIRRMHE